MALVLPLVLARGRRDPPERAIVRMAALARLLAMDGAIYVRQTSRADFARILLSVPDALKRWPWKSARKGTPSEMTWAFASHCHVQAFLFAMLRPTFDDDIVDEQHVKSIGYKHPRVDLALPRLRQIIVVKFLYQATHRSCRASPGRSPPTRASTSATTASTRSSGWCTTIGRWQRAFGSCVVTA